MSETPPAPVTSPAPVTPRAFSRRGWAKWSWLILLGAIVLLSLDYHWRRLPTTASGYFARGRADYLLGEYETAIENFTRAIERNPKDTESYIWRGEAEAKLGDFAHAMPDLEKALALAPRYAKSHAALGDGKAAAWDTPGAIAAYSRAIELDPEYGRCYLERGKMHFDSGHWDEATTDLRRAAGMMINENRITAQLLLWAARARGGDAAGASAELSAVAPIGAMRQNRFWNAAHFLAGSLSEGAYIDAALSGKSGGDDRDHAEAFFLCGVKRVVFGDRAGALELFRKALATDPDGSYAYERARVAAADLLVGFQPSRRDDTTLGVSSIVAGGPADVAGVKPGVTLTSIDGGGATQDIFVNVLAGAPDDSTVELGTEGAVLRIRLGSSAPTR